MTKKPVKSGKKLQIKKETLRDLDPKGKGTVRGGNIGGNIGQIDARLRAPVVSPKTPKVISAVLDPC